MYSFDVFDTLITRTTAVPRGIFALMKQRMVAERDINGLDDFVIDNFYELRANGEELARATASHFRREEVSLKEIYEAVALCGYVSVEQIEYLMKLEQETEIENVLGISANIERVKGLLEQGERVILISDMYLPADTIKRMLIKADPVLGGVTLHVSSMYCLRKTTANLYRKVQELEAVDYAEWTHIGDNPWQDIDIPLHLGISVELCEKPKRTSLEDQLIKENAENAGLQLMIGAAIRANVKKRERKGEDTAEDAYSIGCRYAGPLLYMYGEWLVNQAIKKGIKRLYFIARDGYIVKKVVDFILEARKEDIATYYIYGSRKAWRMSALSKEHYNLYQLIWWSHAKRIVSLEKLANVLQVPLEELYCYLPGVYSRKKENVTISNQELEYITEYLEKSEAFQEYHLRTLAERRRLAQAYLQQEIDTSDDNFAFVDVAGSGLTQGSLKDLLKEQYDKPIRTFFFKIDRVNLIKDSVTYVFVPGRFANSVAIEMICRAPHGQTKGYVENAGRYTPILEGNEGRSIEKHGFYEYESGILELVKQLIIISKDRGITIGSTKMAIKYFTHIAQNPSKEVLEYFASMPSDETGRGKDVMEYAPRLTREEIKEIFLGRTYEPIELYYKGTNLDYSILRASEEEKELIKEYERERYGELGKSYRKEKELQRQVLREQYGNAAFYPHRLLEEELILYGAGRFGQKLYKKICETDEHKIILWVDKNVEKCHSEGLDMVKDVAEIMPMLQQIVIAVADEAVAEEIKQELSARGIESERIFWIQPQYYPDNIIQWQTQREER